MFSLFETFIVVYETKSFTLAGKYLFISQPTVTVRIKKLEEELKSTLFLRGKHQEIIPTEAAILFYPKAIAYLKKWEEDQAEVQKKSLAKHPFKIGVSHSAALSIMPRIFKVFEGELEHLDVEINMYDSEKVFELEERRPTTIGSQIAMAHVYKDSVKKSGIAVMRMKYPVKWSRSSKVKLVFFLAINMEESNEILKLFKYLYALIDNKEDIQKILEANSSGEIYELLMEEFH